MIVNPLGKSGGLVPIIKVTAPTGSTVTCDSVQGTEVSGTWTFKVAIGTHTIVATSSDQSQTATESVVVDEVAIFSITIKYAWDSVSLISTEEISATATVKLWNADIALPYNSKIYIFGSSSNNASTIYEFDTSTETFSVYSSSALSAISNYNGMNCGAFIDATKVLLVCRAESSTSCAIGIFDFTTGATTLKTTFTSGNIYLEFGGLKIIDNKGYFYDSTAGKLYCYDIANESLSVVVSGMATYTYNSSPVYAFGKCVYYVPSNQNQGGTTMYEYDTETGQNTVFATVTPQISVLSSVAEKNISLVIGGFWNTSSKGQIVAFDAVAKTLTSIGSLSRHIAYGTSASVDGTTIYTFGGYDYTSGGWNNRKIWKTEVEYA